jgi:zinc protease
MRVLRQPSPTGAATFSATYLGPAGWAYDPVGEEGIARAVAQLAITAAGPFDRVALARRLDRAGATLSQEVSAESVQLTIWGPADLEAELLGVLADAVLRPRLDAEGLDRVRRQLLERQLREWTQPAGRADRELLRAVFPRGHPYRTTGLGDRRSAARLAPGRLSRFHRAHYTGGGGALVVTTAASLAAVVRSSQRAFHALAERAPVAFAIPRLTPAPPRRIEIDLPGRSQVEVRVGGPSIPQSDPAYPAAYLANQVLGGRPYLARLFQRVRERNGLAYHASSQLETLRHGGFWSAQAGTGGDRWRRVVPMVEEEVARLRSSAVPARELSTIRESSIGEIPLALESTADAHGLAVEIAYHDLPADFWLDWPERLRSRGPADVRSAAAVAFGPSRSATVVVGPLRAHRSAPG